MQFVHAQRLPHDLMMDVAPLTCSLIGSCFGLFNVGDGSIVALKWPSSNNLSQLTIDDYFYDSYPGGGTKPPKFCSINRANSMQVWSPRYGPMIWIPTGRPERVRPAGAAVAGR